MSDFLSQYGISIVLFVIGTLLVVSSYASFFTKSSGIPFVGGVLIAASFLITPYKWFALLGLLDGGLLMIIILIVDRIKYKKAENGINDIISMGYLAGDELPEELKETSDPSKDAGNKLKVHILETDEKIEWKYRINYVYELKHPRVYFAICINNKGNRYLLVDRNEKHIEAMSYDLHLISIKGLQDKNKEMTVVLEIDERKS